MKRILIDYKRLPHEIAALLIETYPDGYGDDDIISFRSAKGEIIEAVELRAGDILYLVKISKSFANFIANFETTIENELDGNTVKDSSTKNSNELEEEIPELEINLDHESGEEHDEDL